MCSCIFMHLLGLRNTICKHIHVHAIVMKYRPQQSYVMECVSTVHGTEADMYTGTCDLDTCEMEDIPEVAAEVESVLGPGVLPSMTESQAILNEVSAKHQSNDVEQQMTKADDFWLSIRNMMSKDVELANVAVKQMTKLKSLLTALQNKSDTPRLPLQDICQEPANKKAEKQRKFVKMKKIRPRRAEVTASKRTHQEKEFLLNTLSGIMSVSSHQPPMEHDYVGNAISQTIQFEHS